MDFSQASPLIRCAYAIAEDAHRGQFRESASRKEEADKVPYIEHPLFLYHTALELGFDDEVLLATCLLHDVVEDVGRYNDPEILFLRLYQDLQEFVSAEEAENLAGQVLTAVQAVTNQKAMPESKRTWQVMHMRKTTAPIPRIVKILDQAHNILDTVNDPPAWPQEKIFAYVEKAREVAWACSQLDPRVDAYFGSIYNQARDILRSGSMEQIDHNLAIQQAFNADRTVIPFTLRSRFSPASGMVEINRIQGDITNESGLSTLYINQYGQVTGFCVEVQPQFSRQVEINVNADKFRDALEAEKSFNTQVETGITELNGDKFVRFMRLASPVPLRLFRNVAEASHMMGPSMAEAIDDYQRQTLKASAVGRELA
jgi:hypothetical protein